jgi:hypothetical protein
MSITQNNVFAIEMDRSDAPALGENADLLLAQEPFYRLWQWAESVAQFLSKLPKPVATLNTAQAAIELDFQA